MFTKLQIGKSIPKKEQTLDKWGKAAMDLLTLAEGKVRSQEEEKALCDVQKKQVRADSQATHKFPACLYCDNSA